ncbi:hypothetical protein [Polycladidibacter stylochi]|nr:hypothetical protein [Pseudovibrio stylochi]
MKLEEGLKQSAAAVLTRLGVDAFKKTSWFCLTQKSSASSLKRAA